MIDWMLTGLIIIAYILGSFPTAVLVAKRFGLANPTSVGSHNPGATNMLRIGGKRIAGLTLLGDLVKGLVAVYLGRLLNYPDSDLAILLIAVLIGHSWPVFNRFKGGKGVATLVGGLVGIDTGLALAYLGTWLVLLSMFRLSSLAALVATLLTPVYAWLLVAGDLQLNGLLSISCLLVLMRHHQNIKRLLAGSES